MIESSFFVDKQRNVDKSLLGVNSIQGIEYHLAKSLPRGSTVSVIFPKEILTEVLPRVALDRSLRVVLVGGAQALRDVLLKQGSLAMQEGVPIDVFLTEPTAFGRDGAWVNPRESSALANIDVVAVGSVLQWFSHSPRDCDLVKIKTVVSEKGVFSSSHFDEEVRSILP